MNVIAKVIDCFSPLTAEKAKDLKAAGYSAVGRYLGHLTHGWSKSLTPAEVGLLKAVGPAIISIWEGGGNKRDYFTYAQGLQDGKQAALEAKALGQPEGTPIYFAVDYDTTDPDMARIRLYFDGVKKTIGNYKVGCYGGYKTVSNVAADYYWQTCAWSGGKISPRAHLYQDTVDTSVAGLGVDIDDVYKDAGWWPNASPQQHPQEALPSYDVLVDGHVFKAIAVNDGTFVLWSALQVTGSQFKYHGNGLMAVNGKDVQGVVYQGDTYLPWASLAASVESKKVEWSFTTK